MLRRQEVGAALLSVCTWCGLACTTSRISRHESATVEIATPDRPEAPPAATAAPGRPVAPRGPTQPIAWRKDAELAMREADRSGHPIMVYLRAEWCVGCLELERAWQTDAALERASRSFVPLWLDATDDRVLAEVSARFGAMPVPSLLLVDRKTGRRSLLDSRAALDHALDSVLAFISEDPE